MAKRKPLTEKQQAYRKRLLAQVHLSQKYTDFYAYDEDAYRDMLVQHFNVRSASELNIDELKALVSFLNYQSQSPVVHGSKAQLAFLRNRWQIKANDPSDNGIRKLCEKLFGFMPMRLEMLSKDQINGLINAVNRM